MLGCRRPSQKSTEKLLQTNPPSCGYMTSFRRLRILRSTKGIKRGQGASSICCESPEVYSDAFQVSRIFLWQCSQDTAQVHEIIPIQNPCCPASAIWRPATSSNLLPAVHAICNAGWGVTEYIIARKIMLTWKSVFQTNLSQEGCGHGLQIYPPPPPPTNIQNCVNAISVQTLQRGSRT